MIPFSKPDINNRYLKRVENTIKSGWLAHGKNSTKLENLLNSGLLCKSADLVCQLLS